MSFEALFDSVREEYPGRRIRIVFGCPGRKAQRRRRELGEAAGASCDKVYLTEEDAGEEPVLDICREIEPWVTGRGCACEIIPDRGEAIHRAIEEADADTVLLLTGKGRETRQKRGLQYIDTPSDVAYVERWLGGQGDADESPAADAQNTGTAE
ncbi:MAG: glutamate ligase domain-containing protein [Anaerovoracaceae bacterium]